MKIVSQIKHITIKVSMIFANILLIMMAALVTFEVILRWFFGESTMVSTDFAAYAMGILFYWGASKTMEEGKFVRIDLLYDIYKGRLKKIFNVIFDLVVLYFNGTLTYHFSVMLRNTLSRNLRATNIYQTPLWVPRLLLFIGILLFNVYLICRIIEDILAENQLYSNKKIRQMEDEILEKGGGER